MFFKFNFTIISWFLPQLPVTGSSGDQHVVRLFRDGKPSQHCTCESTVTCSHITAAMMSLDYEYHPRNEKPNLTRYRKNVNKKADSRSRTKKKSKPLSGYRKMKRKEAQVLELHIYTYIY